MVRQIELRVCFSYLRTESSWFISCSIILPAHQSYSLPHITNPSYYMPNVGGRWMGVFLLLREIHSHNLCTDCDVHTAQTSTSATSAWLYRCRVSIRSYVRADDSSFRCRCRHLVHPSHFPNPFLEYMMIIFRCWLLPSKSIRSLTTAYLAI